MEFSQFLHPLIQKCRHRYGSCSLTLEMQNLRVELNDIPKQQGDKSEIEANAETTTLRVASAGKILTAKAGEVRFKIYEPTAPLSRYLSSLILCTHNFQYHSAYTKKALTFCNSNHSMTAVKLTLNPKCTSSDRQLTDIVAQLLACHLQTEKAILTESIRDVCYPLATSDELYFICQNEKKMCYKIEIFDKTGWKIGSMNGIHISKKIFISICPSNKRAVNRLLKNKILNTDSLSPFCKQKSKNIYNNSNLALWAKKVDSASNNKIRRTRETRSNKTKISLGVNHNQQARIKRSAHRFSQTMPGKKNQKRKLKSEDFVAKGGNLPEEEEIYSGNRIKIKAKKKEKELIRRKIRNILRSFVDDFIDDQTTFTRLGLDSFQLASFEIKLRKVVGNQYDIPEGCVFEHSCVSQLTKFLTTSKAQQGADIAKSILAATVRNNHKIPLSISQRQLVFMAIYEKENNLQFIECYSMNLIDLDLVRLRHVLNRMTARQNILRTVYRVDSQTVLSLTESYFCLYSRAELQNSVELNIFQKPPVAFYLRERSGFCQLVITMHHIMTDGFSMNIFARESLELYQQKVLQRLKSSFAELTLKELKELENVNNLESRKKFWREIFADKALSEIPTDKLDGKLSLRRGQYLRIQLEKNTNCYLKKLRDACDVTLFSCLVGTFYIMIKILFGIEDFCIGIPVTKRNDEESRSVMGCFVNLVPLRAKTGSNETVKKYFQKILKQITIAISNQLPFNDLIKTIDPKKEFTTANLFQIMIVLDSFDPITAAPQRTPQFHLIKESTGFVKYDQTWYFEAQGKDISAITVEYNSDVFYRNTITMLVKKFLNLIKKLNFHLKDPIQHVHIESPSDKMSTYCKYVENVCDFPFDKTTVQIFDQQNIRKPCCTSVIYQSSKYSIDYLRNQSKCIAMSLQNEYVKYYGEFARPDTTIALLMRRSPNMVAAVLAVWKCGLAVVPLSIEWPDYLIGSALKQIGNPPLLFSSQISNAKEIYGLTLNCDVSHGFVNISACKQLRRCQQAQNLAYVTFTSGTTNKPKGVCTNFTGLNNLILSYTETLAISTTSSVYQVVNYAFDIFFADFSESCANGAQLVLAESQIPAKDELQSVTHAYIMPAYLASLKKDSFPSLKNLLKLHFGGEPPSTNFLYAAISSGIDVYQQYGLTEHTVYSTLHRMKFGDHPRSIGKPIKNTFLMKDESSDRCCVFGIGLSRGYFDNEKANRASFKEKNFHFENSSLYQPRPYFLTEDKLKFDASGYAQFCGRLDRVQKIRGMTVNLVELENQISALPQILNCSAILLHLDGSTSIAICVTLDEFSSACTNNNINEIIKVQLSQRVPAYMVPSKILVLQEIPTNSNGKTDITAIKALIDAENDKRKTEEVLYNKDQHPEDKIFHKLIEESLNKTEIDYASSFFENGGDSLKALMLQQRIEETLFINFNIKEIFDSSTTIEIIDKIKVKQKQKRILIRQEIEKSKIATYDTTSYNMPMKRIPLSFQQEGLWFLHQLSEEVNKSYIIYLQVTINKVVEVLTMRTLLNHIVMKHPLLRTQIAAIKVEPEQSVLSGTESYFSSVPANFYSKNCWFDDLTPFVPLKIKTAADSKSTCIFLSVHHILIDGYSLQIIKTDLSKAYINLVNHFPLYKNKYQNNPQDIRYFLHCKLQKAHENDLLSESRKWAKFFENTDPLVIPCDFPETKPLKTLASRISVPLNMKKSSAKLFCKQYNCSTFTLLLATYTILMGRLSGQKTFTVGMPVANRSLNNSTTVGLFANTVLLKIDTVFNGKNEFIASVKNSIIQSLKCQHIPFEFIVRHLNPGRSSTNIPCVHHSVVMHEGSQISVLKDKKVTFSFKEIPPKFAKFDQEWSFTKTENNYTLTVEYSKQFSQQKIKQEITQFKKILSQLVADMRLPSVHMCSSQLTDTFVTAEKSVLKSRTVNDKTNIDSPKEVKNSLKEPYTKTFLEAQVRQIWQRVLHCQVSVDDNFFTLGGHSLLAAKVCFEINNELHYNCPIRLLLENQTIQQLVEKLLTASREDLPLTKEDFTRKISFNSSIAVCELQKPILDFCLNHPHALAAYITGFTVQLEQACSYSRLQKSLNMVLMKHPVLRTSFTNHSRTVHSVAHSGTECFLTVRESQEGNCEVPSPFKKIALITKIENHKGRLYYKLWLSHVLVDQQSLKLIAKDLSEAYSGISVKQKKTMSYSDYSQFLKNEIEKKKKKVETYWEDKLKDIVIEDFTVMKSTPAKYDYLCDRLIVHFQGLNRILRQLVNDFNVPPLAVVLAKFAETLSERTAKGQNIVIACPFSMRAKDTQNTVGFFLHALPVTINLKNTSTESARLCHTMQVLQEAYDNSMVSTEFIQEKLKGQTPKVMITFEESVNGDDLLNNCKIKEDDGNKSYTKYELTFFLKTVNDDIEIKAEFMKSLFIVEVVRDIVNEWGKRISKTMKRETLTQDPESPVVEDLPKATLPHLLQKTTTLAPSRLAISNKGQTLTYSSMFSAINRITKEIKQKAVCLLGEFLRRDTIVPVIAKKSLGSIFCCLAALNAGASYLPIDETNPKKRINTILRKAGASFYLANANQQLLPTIPAIVNFDKLSAHPESTKTFRKNLGINDIAYTIYTSGTTGEAKGVVIENGSLVNLAIQSTKNFFMAPSDCVYQLTNFCFDNSVLEIVMAISNGSRLFVKEDLFVPSLFVKEVYHFSITHALLFPSLVEVFEREELLELRKLRYWIVGAEKISGKTLYKAISDGTKIIQNYGPTESTAYALFRRMHICDHPNNLGKCINNANMFNARDFSRKAPNFTINELILQGTNLMRGYLESTINANSKTKKPIKSYATGDLVRRLPDGTVVFIERKDNQIKLRGFRIDLTEIEAVISQLSCVRQSKVILKKPEKRLVAFITLKCKNKDLKDEDILSHCKERLPYYMVPTHCFRIDSLPLTDNSKTDFRCLERIAQSISKTVQVQEPEGHTERKLLKIFQDVLNEKYLSVNDDFFSLGGNSLTARKLIEAVETLFKVQLSMKDITENNTVRKMKVLVEVRSFKSKEPQVGQSFDEVKYDRKAQNLHIMSYEQQQVYYLNSTTQACYYNLLFSQKFPSAINFKHFCHSFHRIVLKQPSLRTVFRKVKLSFFQFLLSGTEVYFHPHIEYSENKIKKLVTELEKHKFDLSLAPPLKCLLLKDSGSFTVFIVTNHIISDAWSTQILERELSNIYQATPNSVSWKKTLSYSYIDYAHNQQSEISRKEIEAKNELYAESLRPYISESKTLWRSETENNFMVSDFRSYHGSLSGNNYEKLLQFCSTFKCFPSLIFLTALTFAIHMKMKISTIIVGIVTANRNHLNADIIGNFLNTILVPSINNYNKNRSVTNHLIQLKKFAEPVQDYQSVPLFQLLRKIRKLTKKRFTPEIIFNCRYDLEDGTVNSMSVPNVPMPNKCAYAVEMDVDFIDGKYEWALRVHEKTNPKLQEKSFAAFLESSLLELIHMPNAEATLSKTFDSCIVTKPEECKQPLPCFPSKHVNIGDKLREIWHCCLLGTDFSETDDFFLIGGDSISFLKLHHLIIATFHIDLSLEQLTCASSFDLMQQFIEQNIGKQRCCTWCAEPSALSSEIVLKLNYKNKQDSAIVFFHPLFGGVIFPYCHLLRSLIELDDSLTIFGLQHPNSFSENSSDPRVSSTLEELCKVYSERLSNVIGGGLKCVFIGASLGGILSYECAHYLMSQGK